MDPQHCKILEQVLAPLTYLTQARMDLAARLLLRTDDSLAKIASRVGYDSEFAFNRAFKKKYGAPPRRFRKTGSVESSELLA